MIKNKKPIDLCGFLQCENCLLKQGSDECDRFHKINDNYTYVQSHGIIIGCAIKNNSR